MPLAFNGAAEVYSPKKGVTGATCSELVMLNANFSLVYGLSPGPCHDPMFKLPSQARNSVVQTDVLLGYNEPDLSTTMQEAVDAWPMVDAMCPRGSCKQGSPSPSQLDRDWIPAWVAAYRDKWGSEPRFEFLGMHCHFLPSMLGECLDLLAHYEALSRQYGVPLWVTEVSCIPGVDFSLRDCQIAGGAMIAAMNASPYVERWYWYTAYQDLCWDSSVGFEQTDLVYRPCSRLTEVGRWLSGVQ